MYTSSTLYTGKMARLVAILMLTSVINGCAVATVVAITAGATMVADRRTFSKQIDDQSIEFSAHKRLNKQQALSKNANLHVVSINGTVLMVGQAPNSYLRELAVKTIQDIPDIVAIHNQIRISSNTGVSTKANDVWLTSKVKSALLADENISAEDIKIVTENAEVFLLGIVTNEEANIAVDITRNINGVSRVFKAFEYL